MNPNYRVQIDVCLSKPVTDEAIWLRRIQTLPFVPVEGQSIRLTSEDEEETLDIILESVIYDSHSGQFVVDITDEALIVEYAESGSCDTAALIKQYAPFGFIRLNYPTGQVVRA